MKLSNGEKLILVMLSDLCDTLGAKSEVDPSLVKTSILTGHTWALRWLYPGIVSEEYGSQPPEVDEVCDILNMWGTIETSYGALSSEDKDRVIAEAKVYGTVVQFMGFDGNQETKHFSVARFLVEELDRYQEFKDRSLNSHFPGLDGYRRMHDTYIASGTHYPLTADQIIQLLNAQRHPDRQNDIP